MDISSISNSQIDIQTLLANPKIQTNQTKANDTTNKEAYYARKGEPMYMADMDADEDGVVTLDEFRDYCKSKNINVREMVKMSQVASSFRVMQAEENTIDYISKLKPNVFPKLKQTESGYTKQNEKQQYNISNDSNKSNKVSYQEYMEYCKKNAVSDNLKNNTKIADSNDDNLKIQNSGKAIKSYNSIAKNYVKSTFEKAV